MCVRNAYRGRIKGAIERETHVAHVAKSLPRIFLQTASQHETQGFGRVRGQRDEIDFLVDHGARDFGDGLARERASSGEHFVKHDGKRPDVRAFVGGLAARLFG